MSKCCPTPVKWAVAVLGALFALYSLLTLARWAQVERKQPRELSGLARKALTRHSEGLSQKGQADFQAGVNFLLDLGQLHADNQFTPVRVKALVDATPSETIEQAAIAARVGGDLIVASSRDVTFRELWRAAQRLLAGW